MFLFSIRLPIPLRVFIQNFPLACACWPLPLPFYVVCLEFQRGILFPLPALILYGVFLEKNHSAFFFLLYPGIAWNTVPRLPAFFGFLFRLCIYSVLTTPPPLGRFPPSKRSFPLPPFPSELFSPVLSRFFSSYKVPCFFQFDSLGFSLLVESPLLPRVL